MPKLEALELDAVPDEIILMIDSGIADFSLRTLLTSAEVVDLLLDIRSQLTTQHKDENDDTEEHVLAR